MADPAILSMRQLLSPMIPASSIPRLSILRTILNTGKPSFRQTSTLFAKNKTILFTQVRDPALLAEWGLDILSKTWASTTPSAATLVALQSYLKQHDLSICYQSKDQKTIGIAGTFSSLANLPVFVLSDIPAGVGATAGGMVAIGGASAAAGAASTTTSAAGFYFYAFGAGAGAAGGVALLGLGLYYFALDGPSGPVSDPVDGGIPSASLDADATAPSGPAIDPGINTVGPVPDDLLPEQLGPIGNESMNFTPAPTDSGGGAGSSSGDGGDAGTGGQTSSGGDQGDGGDDGDGDDGGDEGDGDGGTEEPPPTGDGG